MTFAVIAFKPSSSEVCRGCVTEVYPEDFKIEAGLTEQDMISTWAMYLATELEPQEEGYEVHVLVDSGPPSREQELRWLPLVEAKAAEIRETTRRAAELTSQRIREEAKRAKAEQERKKEEDERQELARLKAKYEGKKA